MEYLESSAQAEQLKAIGATLLQERQAKSISLEEIATKTYIPLRLLSAIEAGRLDLLPEPVFIQGFIRRYADAIGLDGVALSQEFSLQSPVLSAPIELPNLELVAEAPPSPSVTRPAWMYWLGGVVGVSAIGLMITFFARPQATPPAASNSATETRSLAQKPLAQPSAPLTAAPKGVVSPEPLAVVNSGASPAPKATGPVQVKLNLTDESWIEVKVDGKVAFEGTLQKGTERSWGGQKQVQVSTGNAGGVSVSYNNGAAKPLGELGAVKEVSFPTGN